MSTTVNAHRLGAPLMAPGLQQLLQLTLIVDGLTFLTAAALNFGAHIPLGVVTIQFPFRVIPAGVGEAIIGSALLLAGISMRRSWMWIGFWLSTGGIAFGLVMAARSRGASFDVHLIMLTLAASLLALLLCTAQRGPAAAAQNTSAASRLQLGMKATGGLMAFAGLTLLCASAIHFGLTAVVINDPFTAAAIPEAVLGGIMVLGSAILASDRPGSWEAAVALTVLTILLTLYGFSVTLRGGRVGDLAYHAALLATLFTTFGLLLSPIGRRKRTTGTRP